MLPERVRLWTCGWVSPPANLACLSRIIVLTTEFTRMAVAGVRRGQGRGVIKGAGTEGNAFILDWV